MHAWLKVLYKYFVYQVTGVFFVFFLLSWISKEANLVFDQLCRAIQYLTIPYAKYLAPYLV